MANLENDLKAELNRSGVPDEVKSQVWKHFWTASDQDQFKQGLSGMSLPDATKQSVFNLKFPGQNTATPPGPPKPEQVETGETFLREAGKALNPITAVKGLAQALWHPIDTINAIEDQSGEQVKKAVTAFKEGRYGDIPGHVVGAVPLVGPPLLEAADTMVGTSAKVDKFGKVDESGRAPNFGAGAGKAVGAIVGLRGLKPLKAALPNMSPAVTSPVTIPVSNFLGSQAVNLYRGVLRPGSETDPVKVRAAIDYALENEIPTSTGSGFFKNSVDTVKGMIREYNKYIDSRIATNPNAPIWAQDIANELRTAPPGGKSPMERFLYQSDPESDLAALAKKEESLMKQWGDGPVTATDAQNIKKGDYRKIERIKGDQAYGQSAGPDIEALKAFAGGWKKKLEEYFPEIKNVNATEGTAIDLVDLMEGALGAEYRRGVGLPGARGSMRQQGAAAINAIAKGPGIRTYAAILLHRGSQASGSNKPLSMMEAAAKVNLLFNHLNTDQQTEPPPGGPEDMSGANPDVKIKVTAPPPGAPGPAGWMANPYRRQ